MSDYVPYDSKFHLRINADEMACGLKDDQLWWDISTYDASTTINCPGCLEAMAIRSTRPKPSRLQAILMFVAFLVMIFLANWWGTGTAWGGDHVETNPPVEEPYQYTVYDDGTFTVLEDDGTVSTWCLQGAYCTPSKGMPIAWDWIAGQIFQRGFGPLFVHPRNNWDGPDRNRMIAYS